MADETDTASAPSPWWRPFTQPRSLILLIFSTGLTVGMANGSVTCTGTGTAERVVRTQVEYDRAGPTEGEVTCAPGQLFRKNSRGETLQCVAPVTECQAECMRYAYLGCTSAEELDSCRQACPNASADGIMEFVSCARDAHCGMPCLEHLKRGLSSLDPSATARPEPLTPTARCQTLCEHATLPRCGVASAPALSFAEAVTCDETCLAVAPEDFDGIVECWDRQAATCLADSADVARCLEPLTRSASIRQDQPRAETGLRRARVPKAASSGGRRNPGPAGKVRAR